MASHNKNNPMNARCSSPGSPKSATISRKHASTASEIISDARGAPRPCGARRRLQEFSSAVMTMPGMATALATK